MSEKKKLLYITSRVPWPLEKGDKLRAYYQLRELSSRFEIHLACINDSELHPKAKDELLKYCKSVHIFPLKKGDIYRTLFRKIFSAMPMQVAWFWSDDVKLQLDELIFELKPDRIFCQLIRTAEYARHHKDIIRTIDYMDVFSVGMERRISKVAFWKRPVFLLEKKRVSRYEADVFRDFDRYTVISEQDRDLLPVKRPSEIAVIPNGVDMNYFHHLHRNKDHDILFNGNMNYPPNIESAVFLVKKVLPILKEKYPGIKILISGANPARAVRQLESENVTITGWVDDVRESFARSRILVAPMQSSIGLQNKLLEAMAMRLPCITTPLSNNALKAQPGKEILLAETAEEFAEQIILLLSRPEKAVSISDEAWKFVRDYYSWQPICDRLANLIEADKK